MKISEYKSYDDLPLFLNAAMVAKVLGIAPSSSYELMHVVGTSSVSFAPPLAVRRRSRPRPKPHIARPTAAGLAHSAVPPLPTKPKDGFAGAPMDFPVLKVGSRIVVPKERFIQWVEQHTKGGEIS